MPEATKIALIFGVSGQDGAYLSQLLLNKGYEVHGTSRDKELNNFSALKSLGTWKNIKLHSAALHDFRSVVQTVSAVKPLEIYNLAAQSSVELSFEQPAETINSSLNGTLNILEALRFLGFSTKAYFASSSECFGDTGLHPADERTPFRPSSPYGVAKAAAHLLVANYRDAYKLAVCSGILFNHESPLRPQRFVTQKVIRGAVSVANGKGFQIELGNLSVSRDWGWAPEYVEAMWLMLQQENLQDYVIATGSSYTLEEFVSAAFEQVGLDWRKHVVFNNKLLRPSDLKMSLGNPSRAASVLGWRAQTNMAGVVSRLVEAEVQRSRLEDVLR